jgi:hypothetical protein
MPGRTEETLSPRQNWNTELPEYGRVLIRPQFSDDPRQMQMVEEESWRETTAPLRCFFRICFSRKMNTKYGMYLPPFSKTCSGRRFIELLPILNALKFCLCCCCHGFSRFPHTKLQHQVLRLTRLYNTNGL